MLRYTLSRLAYSGAVIFVALSLVFFVTHLLGDPVRISVPVNARPEQIDAIRERLHLDDPLYAQFLRFVNDALHGSFGDSFWQGGAALPLVMERIPATLQLALAAFVLTVPLGVTAGVLAALRPGTWSERVLNLLSFVSVSIVDFWLALMLIVLFAVTLGWLPTSGYGGPQFIVLPAMTLAIIASGALAQVSRAAVAEELSKSYVAAARARGVKESRVIVRHALRNALIPIVTLGGGILIGLVNGAIVVETIFGWPGLGQLTVQAINHRDLPLIQATVFVTAVMVALLNLAVDLLYGYLNPRVGIAGG
jgi:peptide/nickel transport system permease protein